MAAGDGSRGFVLYGVDSGDRAGAAVDVVGDVNDDGFGDLLVGAPLASPEPGTTAGEAYVLYGRPAGFPAELELASLASGDGSTGFVLHGEPLPASQFRPTSNAGRRVSGGDLNGDGVDDLIVAATSLATLYVLYGRTGPTGGFPAEVTLSSLATGDGTDGFVFRGAAQVSRDASDLNGDGVDDLVTSVGYEFSNSYAVFGRTATVGGFPAVLDWTTIQGGDGSYGYELLAADEFDGSGYAAAIGDVNSDGIGDWLLGAPNGAPEGRDFAGESYVVYGRDTAVSEPFNRLGLSRLGVTDPADGFRLFGEAPGDYAGRAVVLGDINRDGIDDIIVGGTGNNSSGADDAGSVYVVFGRPGNPGVFPAEFELGSLRSGDGSTGFVITDAQAQSQLGEPLAVGDFNGDGTEDILIGTKSIGQTSGRAVVVFGRSGGGFPAEFSVAALDGSSGFVLVGLEPIDRQRSPSAKSGKSLDAGDINGDGIADIIIGDSLATADERSEAGRIYVVFGSPTIADPS